MDRNKDRRKVQFRLSFFSDDVIRLIWSLFVSQKKKQKKLR